MEGWEAFSDSEGGQLFDDESDLGDPFFNATLNVTTATLLLTDNLPLLNDPTLAEYAHALVEGISALASSGALARLFHNEDVELNQHDTLHILRNILRRFYPHIPDINDLPMGPSDCSTDLPDIPELVSPPSSPLQLPFLFQVGNLEWVFPPHSAAVPGDSERMPRVRLMPDTSHLTYSVCNY